MGLLDFIKNRMASRQQAVAENAQEKKPETAKQMYAREVKQEEASRKPLDRMPPEQQAQVAEIKSRLEKATQFNQPEPPANTPAPADGADSRQAIRQKSMNQDEAAPAQSPTSAQRGITEVEKKAPAPSSEPGEAPSKPSPTPRNDRPQTLPRRPPSWER